MKNFNWDEFKEGNVAVHCNTEEKANDFARECDDKSMKWSNGNNLLYNNFWYMHKENTCYEYYLKNIGSYYLDYYKKEKYKIIEWEI